MEEHRLGGPLWLNLEGCLKKAVLELEIVWMGLVSLMHISFLLYHVMMWYFQLLSWKTMAKTWKILRMLLLPIY